jgi:hypothetical protein
MLLAQLVKAVMEVMANAATPMPAPPPAPIIPTVSEATIATNDVVHLVCLVKSMREMGCEPYSGEQDAEVVGRWIRKVEKTMIQIKIHCKARPTPPCRILSAMAQPNLASTPHGFVLAAHKLQNTSCKVRYQLP